MEKNTFNITTSGYGGEVVMGRVPKEAYDYFERKSIDIEDYANDWSGELGVPDKFQPFNPGSWHECDDLAHNCNIEMSDACFITVEDSKGRTIWEAKLGIESLRMSGISVDDSNKIFVDDEKDGAIVFFGQSFEKGGFFTGILETNSSFDPKKLNFTTININGWITLESLEYDSEIIEDTCESGTTGKSQTFDFLISDGSTMPKSIHKIPESNLTTWFPSTTTPIHTGYYEIQYRIGPMRNHLVWWEGDSFYKDIKIDEKKCARERLNLAKILHWRGCKSRQ